MRPTRPFGCDDGHVRRDARVRSPVDRDAAKLEAGAGADHARRNRLDPQILLESEQLLQLPRTLGAPALLLELHLQLAELPLQLIVLGADAAKISIAAPGVANAAGDARGAALHLGERAEGDHLEQRHAAA